MSFYRISERLRLRLVGPALQVSHLQSSLLFFESMAKWRSTDCQESAI